MLRSFVELIIILCNLPCNCRNELRSHIYTLLVTSAFIAATLVVIFEVVIPSDVYRAKVLNHLRQRVEGQVNNFIFFILLHERCWREKIFSVRGDLPHDTIFALVRFLLFGRCCFFIAQPAVYISIYRQCDCLYAVMHSTGVS